MAGGWRCGDPLSLDSSCRGAANTAACAISDLFHDVHLRGRVGGISVPNRLRREFLGPIGHFDRASVDAGIDFSTAFGTERAMVGQGELGNSSKSLLSAGRIHADVARERSLVSRATAQPRPGHRRRVSRRIGDHSMEGWHPGIAAIGALVWDSVSDPRKSFRHWSLLWLCTQRFRRIAPFRE